MFTKFDDALRVTLVANAGIILNFRGITLLVDGIFGKSGHRFSAPTAQTLADMEDGAAPFEKIDYLLFTHAHPDHFSPKMTIDFLRRRTVKGIFFPSAGAASDGASCAAVEGFGLFLAERKIPAVPLSHMTDNAVFKIEPDVRVSAFSTLHLDKKYRDVPHFCFCLTFGGKRVLLTSDVDYTLDDLSRVRDVHFRAAFVNPLFFGALRRGRFFKGTLDTEAVCVYHVPFARDDIMQMRRALERDLRLWSAAPQAFALTEPFASVEL